MKKTAARNRLLRACRKRPWRKCGSGTLAPGHPVDPSSIFRYTRLSLYLCLLGALTFSAPVWACDVPVFYYAMEHWAPDPYEAILFHQGPLDESAKEAADRLRADASRINLLFTQVDLSAAAEPSMLRLWEEQSADALPWLVVRYALAAPDGEWVWSGPLTTAAVERLADSPLRREIGRRLLAGQSAVWVLLESGDPAQDQTAAQRLQAALRQAEQELELPVPAEDADAEAGAELWIEFSTVQLSRNDPDEQFFVAMLLDSEWDLELTHEVMAFPVFGRGRVLYALVGNGLDSANIREACAFIVGACSCEVKDQCPGRDLLMTADWGSAMELPSLAGLAQTYARVDTVRADTTAKTAIRETGVLGRNLLLVLLAGGLGVAAATLAMKRAGGKR